jgi:hypothetical protein
MALASSLIPGFKYRITRGPLAEEIVTIVDNVAFPDGDPEGRQRKITVAGPTGDILYILPRLLDERPQGLDHNDHAPVVIHAPAPQPVAVASEAVASNVTPIQGRTLTAATVIAQPITDPMDSRLDHLRPNRAKVRRYISREMSNGMTDIDFLLTFTSDVFRETNEGRPANVMLKGDTQSGKTFLVEVLAVAWADLLGLPKPMPIFTLSGSSGVTDFDLFGQTTSFTDPNTGIEALVWLPGIVDLAAQAGGILYVDEVNALGERVTSSLHPLADHRHFFVNRNKPVLRGGQFMPDTVTAPMDLWIIGTYNEGYRGMGEMNEAFVNRFTHIAWGYDKEVEAKLITSPAIRLLGEALRTARQANQLRTPTGTAALQRCEVNVAAFGIPLGMEVFTGMFKNNERAVVESIIEDRSILVMLQEEQRQARLTP